jgi:UPF0716 protein FxsA
MRPILLILLWPIIEIALFVTVGGAIGLLWTMAIILGTGALGVWLLRSRGLRNAERLRQGMTSLRDPVAALADGAAVLLAGVLLILPGFLTDLLGLLLLLPPVRLAIMAAVARRVKVHDPRRPADPFAARRSDIVIDGEFLEVETDANRPPSGWTRH